MSARGDIWHDLIDDAARNPSTNLEQVFKTLFQDVDGRLVDVEDGVSDFRAVRETILAEVLAYNAEKLAPEFDRIRVLADVGLLFEGESDTSLTIGPGEKTVQIVEAHRGRFTPAGYVGIMKRGNPALFMSGARVSYDRASGLLKVDVDRVSGSGTFSDWLVVAVSGTDYASAAGDAQASADEADQSAQVAVGARDAAIAARDTANSHRIASETAQASAETARDAAAGSATTASGHETAAGAARTAAEAARDAALGYRNDAQSARDTASTHATTVTTQASTATTQAGIATTKAQEAASSAADALAYRNTANQHKADAETAKVAAEAAKTSAETAATTAGAHLSGVQAIALNYIGPSASNPTTAPGGGALAAGMLYWNTVAHEMRVYTGSAWTTAYNPAGSEVVAFNGRTGAVSPQAGDYGANLIGFSPTGGLSSTTVQAALAELDSEKAASGHGHTAAQIPVTPTGGIAATDVQAALAELDSEKAPKANPAFTGTAAFEDLSVDGPAGSVRAIDVKTGGVLRWRISGNATAEGGSNAGTNLVFERFDDAGNSLGVFATFIRSVGRLDLAAGTTHSNLNIGQRATDDNPVAVANGDLWIRASGLFARIAGATVQFSKVGHVHSNVVAGGASGFMTGADKTKLDGIAAGANNYSHPTGDGNLHVPANGTSNANRVLKASGTAGSYSWGQVAWGELTSIPAAIDALDALVPAADRLPYFSGASTAALATLTAFARTLLDDADATTALATLGAAASDHVHGNAVANGAAGFLTGTDKAKLDTVATNANYYVHPTGDGSLHVPATSTTNNNRVLKAGATAGSIAWGSVAYGELTSIPDAVGAIDGLTPAADRLAYYTGASTAALATLTSFARTLLDDADALTARATLGAADVNHVHENATASVAGFMSASDKTKLDGVSPNANNYVHPTGDGNSHVPATGTGNANKVLKAGASANSAAWGSVAYGELTGLPAAIDAIDGLTPAADRLAYYTGASSAALATLSAFARTILDDADGPAVRSTIGAAAASHSHAIGDLPEASAAEFRNKTTGKVLSADKAWDAAAAVAVAYAATVTLDLSTGWNFEIGTLTGGLTLANPSNAKVGQSGFIKLVQDGTGGKTISYGTNWIFSGGDPALSTAANAVDYLFYTVVGAGAIVANLMRDVK